MKLTGRKPSLTPERAAMLRSLREWGASWDTLAELAGVARSTVQRHVHGRLKRYQRAE